MADIRLLKLVGDINTRHVEASDTVRLGALGLGLPAPAAGSLQVSSALLIGASASLPSTGHIRGINNEYLYQRTTGGTDARVVGLSSSNHVILGSTAYQADTFIDAPSGQTIHGYIASADVFSATAAAFTVVPAALKVGSGAAVSGVVQLTANGSVHCDRSSTGDVSLIAANGDDGYFGYNPLGGNAPVNAWVNGSSTVDLRIAQNQVLAVTSSTIYSNINTTGFTAAVSSPTLTQADMTTVAGTAYDLRIEAQDETGTGETVGGNLILAGGSGATYGTVRALCRDGSQTALKVRGAGAQSASLQEWESAAPATLLAVTGSGNLAWGNTKNAPTITHGAIASGNGTDLTIQAQGGGATNGNGGALILAGGAKNGSGADGGVECQANTTRTLPLGTRLLYSFLTDQQATTSTSYVAPTNSGIFQIDPSALPSGRRVIKFGCVVKHGGTLTNGYAELYNLTDSDEVVSSRISTNSLDWEYVEATVTVGAGELVNGPKLYEVRYRTADAGDSTTIASAVLEISYA